MQWPLQNQERSVIDRCERLRDIILLDQDNANILFEANISEYGKNFIRFEAKNKFFLLVSHRSESADFTSETNNNGSE